MSQWLLPVMVLFPMAGGIGAYFAKRRGGRLGDAVTAAVCLMTLALSAVAALKSLSGETLSCVLAGFCGLGLRFTMEGFRAVYALIAAFMWLCTTLFSREYFLHHHHQERYHLFSLLTMGATLGVFLAEDFYTLFVFFEIMSLSSYCLVAHEETPGAMRAAQTYLAIAVGGGMVTLMGLFMLYQLTGTLCFDQLKTAAALVENKTALYLAAALTSVGFFAKAGAFPLHVWLPKAHPVAPAPASALLSGILTKAGVFGLIAVSCNLFGHNVLWGRLLLALAMVTMMLGALLALFSVDLKRALACSSMSQIGFILFGLAIQALLGHHDGLAVYGTFMHMMNHSLLKLALFMTAGAIYMKTHRLNLNDIKGYGRGKPVLHFAFLMGAMGLAGVPLLNGFASKSLLHESLVEYMELLAQEGASAGIYRVVEWLFLITGGMTAAYMTKLYVAIFWEKNATQQARFDAIGKNYASPLTKAVLLAAGALPLVLGAAPQVFLQEAAQGALGFFRSEGPAHAIHYFSGANLIGAAQSLSIAAVLYLVVVRRLLRSRQGEYLNRWPEKLDLENALYRPLLRGVTALLGWVSRCCDRLTDWAFALVRPLGILLARLMDGGVDALALALKNTLFRRRTQPLYAPVGNWFTMRLGRLLNALAALVNHTIFLRHPIETDFTLLLAAGQSELDSALRRVTRSVSFGLLLTCLGLLMAFAYLLFW